MVNATIAINNIPKAQIIADNNVYSSVLTFDHYSAQSRPKNKDEMYNHFIWQGALSILNKRLQARLQSTEGEVASFQTAWNYATPDVLNLSLTANLSAGNIELATQLLNEEKARLLKLGISQTELDRWRKATLENERLYRPHIDTLATPALESALYQQPFIPQKEWLAMLEKALPKLTTQTMNRVIGILLEAESRVLVVHNPSIKAPSKEQLTQWQSVDLANIKAQAIQPNEDKNSKALWAINPSLVGEIVSEKHLPNRLVEWTLSNNVKVVYRYNNGQKGEVAYALSGVGGMNQLSQQDSIYARLALETIGASGLRDMDGAKLTTWLQDNNLKQQPMIGFFDRGISGVGVADKFSTMMNLLHVALTEAEVNPTTWKHYLVNNKQQVGQILKSKQYAWHQQIHQQVLKQDAAFRTLTLDELDAVKPEHLQSIYKHYFAGAQNYQLTIVGDIDEQTVKKAVLASIATLPISKPYGETARDYPRLIKPVQIKVSGRGDRAALTMYQWQLDKQHLSSANIDQLSYLAVWLKSILMENLREKQGLVYALNVTISGDMQQQKDYMLTINYTCDPDNVDTVKKALDEILQQQINNPPPANQLAVWQNDRNQQFQRRVSEPASLLTELATSPLKAIPLVQVDDVEKRTKAPQADTLALWLQTFMNKSVTVDAVWLP